MPVNDGTPRVRYSIFRPEAGGVAIERHALSYDQASAVAKMRRIGLSAYAQTLASGLWVDADTLSQRSKG
jgi:hypothetical protein